MAVTTEHLIEHAKFAQQVSGRSLEDLPGIDEIKQGLWVELRKHKVDIFDWEQAEFLYRTLVPICNLMAGDPTDKKISLLMSILLDHVQCILAFVERPRNEHDR